MNARARTVLVLLSIAWPAAWPAALAQDASAPPADVPAQLERARALIQADKPLEAVALLEPIVARDADRPLVWLTLGRAYRSARSWDKAVAANLKAATFEDVRADASYELACCLASSGRSAEALDALADAVAAGFGDASGARADEGLAALRKEPRFAEILDSASVDPATVGPRAGPGDAQAVVEGDLGRRLDEAVLHAGADGFSGDVLVLRAGQPLLHKGYGLADRARGVPITADTVFAIGSITKSFTAAAILLLEQDGKLRVEDKLAAHLPDVPADKAAITLHQLLTHSAGLDDYVDRPGEGGDFAPLTREAMLQRVLGGALLYPPGTQSRYSNAGYALLAAVVERVSGQPFAQIVRERLLAPAGMADSGFFGDGDRWPDAHVARGYGRRTQRGERSPARWPAPQWALMGGGGLVCTTADLARWVAALQSGPLLGEAERAKVFRGYYDLQGGGSEGYGWVVGHPPGGAAQIAVAGGDDLGFNAVIRAFPDSGTLIVIACNSARQPEATEPIMRALLGALAD